MKHFKKTTALFTIMIVCISTSIVVSAAIPRWSYLAMIRAGMTINSYNLSKITVACDANYNINKIKAKCELQQLDGSWNTIKVWTETANDSSVFYTKSYGVAKNYSYRLKVTATVYKDSDFLESVTEYFDYGYYK